jgi:hypothetical protein
MQLFKHPTILKLNLVRQTQFHGINEIITLNHKNNSMLQLNLNFGFQIADTQNVYANL